MSPDREQSNGELAEDIAALRDEMGKVVHQNVYDADRRADASDLKHLEFRLGVIEDRLTSQGRLAWSGLILPILAMVIGAFFVAALVVPR
jgi:hypothetical protein